ncbi:hypothetical protein BGW80DRAFT_62151 [Lactifluus volemus]|nr:hypothetical protein BGW80DRAFT_62151 [Lactifluus volemus]
MSLETSTRSIPVTVLSSRLSPPSSSPSVDATRHSSLTTTLSPQAEPFTMPSVLSPPIAIDSPAPSPYPASSPTPADTDNKTDSMEVDPTIIEALKTKERMFVLRVGEDMERLVNERK